MEAPTCHLKNNPHMHDQFEMIPEGTSKFFLNSRRHLSTTARESGRENHFQHWCQISNMNVYKHGENNDVVDGSTTNLFICSNKMDSYVTGTRQKYWSDRKEWWCTLVKTTSRDTIKIILGLSLIWRQPKLKSKIGRIAYLKDDTILLQHKQK
jgi:hypothetical protein